MSEETLHKQKFNVEQWPTSKVTLYPSRASVIRRIEGIKLKPGLNEITITDLTSLADPDSIRVAGTTNDHPARINDLTVDSVPNVYSHLSDGPDSEDESEDEPEDEEPESLKAAKEGLCKVKKVQRDVEERKRSSESELALIEEYARNTSHTTSDKTSPATMKETLEIYSSQRKIHYDIIEACEAQLIEIGKDSEKATKIVQKEEKKWQHALRYKIHARKKKLAEKEEKKQERNEKKQEKLPTVYRVRITIEVPGAPFPEESTGGKAPDSDPAVSAAEFTQDATLILTYTTSAASWTPHYDLRLDTTNTARSTLTYRAHFINRTYETWSNAQLTLSTSQASFGGLNEKIPRMESWRVTLKKAYNGNIQLQGANGLFSLAEQKIKDEEKRAWEIAQGQQVQNAKLVHMQAAVDNVQSSMLRGDSAGRKSKAAKISVPNVPAMFYRSTPASDARARSRSPEGSDEDLGFGLLDGADDATVAPGGNRISHAAAGADTYGFTTTYELPTPRTVPSTALVRRHVIAEIPLLSLVFTHIVIPKLKAAAFLKARVTNPSNIPLLPGVAGLTLDGSFLGNLSFPRCSPDETVVLELGVDQSVKVEYERPIVKRGSQGMILTGKEEVGVFKRTMRITNTKGASVSLVVLDQVPMPEDEKLKVTILSPKGLRNVDDVVRNGVGVDGKALTVKPKKPKPAEQPPASSSTAKLESVSEEATLKSSVRRFPSFSKRDSTSALAASTSAPPVPPLPATATAATNPAATSGSASWGTAKATLRKNGEVRFDVDLVKGGCVSIGLEWECRMPKDEGILALS